MTKIPVVIDTMVLLRMLTNKSPYADVLEKIKEKCNKMIFSTPIIKEWRCKAFEEGMSSSILLRKLEDLKQIEKLKKCNKTPINKARKMIESNKCKKPNDIDDLKFIEAALATNAIIITEDPALLDLDPYNCGVDLRIMSVEDYSKTP